MSLSKDALKSLALQASLSPKEEMLETTNKNKKLYIGIPKETELLEQRVALVPESVGFLVANGHRVVVESGAGNKLIFLILIIVNLGQKFPTKPKKFISQTYF